MKTDYSTIPSQPGSEAPVRRGWLKRLGALLGGTLLAGPALARAARRGPTQVQSADQGCYLGEIMLCAFSFPPKGFAMCNGQLLNISQNQALFSLLGATYGGNGTTTFALPDLRGRVLRGTGTSTTGTAYSLGTTGNNENQPVAATNLLAHTHPDNVSSATATASSAVGTVPAVVASTNLSGEAVAVLAYGTDLASNTPTTTSTGSNGAASIAVPTVAPFLALNYCIALQGFYPARN